MYLRIVMNIKSRRSFCHRQISSVESYAMLKWISSLTSRMDIVELEHAMHGPADSRPILVEYSSGIPASDKLAVRAH